jgi:SAM-dependent methyltransferase
VKLAALGGFSFTATSDTLSSVDESHRESAERVRSLIERGLQDPSLFRAALLRVPPTERDGWLDLVLGLGELPDDDPDLPRGCVPYLPCPVDALLRVVEQADVRASDVFVDVGSGLGRAAALVHLLTGASVVGVEIQSGLVVAARHLATRLLVSRISCVEGDAVELTGFVSIGSVFFLYCPFSGERLAKVVADLEPIARTKMIRVCCVDLPLLECSWLTLEPAGIGDPAIYRSTLHDERFGRQTSDVRAQRSLEDIPG